MLILMAMGKTAVSRIIAKIDDTDVSHVALSSREICDHGLVFHSSTQGVEIVSRDYFKKKHEMKRIYDIDVGPYEESALLWSMMKLYEGARYDYLATAYAGIYLLMRKIGISISSHNVWNNRNHFMCLEFAIRAIFGESPQEVIGLKAFEEKVKERLNGDMQIF